MAMESFNTCSKLTYGNTQIGAKALNGESEYINGKLFEGVDRKRKIKARGKLIQIYDPKADMSSPPYWEYENQFEDGESDVPAGYKVRVTGATIKFT